MRGCGLRGGGGGGGGSQGSLRPLAQGRCGMSAFIGLTRPTTPPSMAPDGLVFHPFETIRGEQAKSVSALRWIGRRQGAMEHLEPQCECVYSQFRRDSTWLPWHLYGLLKGRVLLIPWNPREKGGWGGFRRPPAAAITALPHLTQFAPGGSQCCQTVPDV